jgi:hypothetical protein
VRREYSFSIGSLLALLAVVLWLATVVVWITHDCEAIYFYPAISIEDVGPAVEWRTA